MSTELFTCSFLPLFFFISQEVYHYIGIRARMRLQNNSAAMENKKKSVLLPSVCLLGHSMVPLA